MKFYCGIDLSARDFHLCVIDEQPLVGANTIHGPLPAGSQSIAKCGHRPSIELQQCGRGR